MSFSKQPLYKMKFIYRFHCELYCSYHHQKIAITDDYSVILDNLPNITYVMIYIADMSGNTEKQTVYKSYFEFDGMNSVSYIGVDGTRNADGQLIRKKYHIKSNDFIGSLNNIYLSYLEIIKAASMYKSKPPEI